MRGLSLNNPFRNVLLVGAVGAGASVATGGVSLLARRFKDRFLSGKDACGRAVADTNAYLQALKELY